jgi:hypothetical protein
MITFFTPGSSLVLIAVLRSVTRIIVIRANNWRSGNTLSGRFITLFDSIAGLLVITLFIVITKAATASPIQTTLSSRIRRVFHLAASQRTSSNFCITHTAVR